MENIFGLTVVFVEVERRVGLSWSCRLIIIGMLYLVGGLLGRVRVYGEEGWKYVDWVFEDV